MYRAGSDKKQRKNNYKVFHKPLEIFMINLFSHNLTIAKIKK
jgi:hypothetical protein